MRGGFSGMARGGFGNVSYGSDYQSVNTNNFTNSNKNFVSGANVVGSAIPSEWSANVPSREVTDTIRIRITELIRPVTEEEMRKVFDRVGVQVRQLCVEPTSSTTEASVLVQFTDSTVSQHAMTLLNNRFIYNNAHKMTMSYTQWTNGISNSNINNNYNIMNNNNAVLPTPLQAPVMLPPSPLQTMTNKSVITPGASAAASPATLSSVFTTNTIPTNKHGNNNNSANNLTLTPHVTPMITPFTSMPSTLPQRTPFFNNMSSQGSQGIFNPALPLPLVPPHSSTTNNSSQMPMSHTSTLKNVIGGNNNYNVNNSNSNSNVYNNAIMPISQLSSGSGCGVRPITSASIMPEPTQTGFSTNYSSTNNSNTTDPFGSIFGQNNNSNNNNNNNNRQGSGMLRGRGRGRGRRDLTYGNRSTSGPYLSSSVSSASLLPSALRNAPMNPSTVSVGFNPMLPMTQPSMIPVPFLNSLSLSPGPNLGAMMPNMMPPLTNPNDMPTVFLSMTTMPTTEPLQSLFILIEAYGGVVSIRRNNEKRHIVTVKMSSIEEANNVLQYFHRIPFANEKISAKRFPTYHERNPCTDDGDPFHAETVQYDFTASRHRSPMQRSKSYPTCMVKISGCGNYVEADVMTYLNSKSFYPQRIHKENDGSFTVQLDDA